MLNPEERQGLLWDVFRALKDKGFKMDANSYTTCFRVEAGQRSQAELQMVLHSLPKGTHLALQLEMASSPSSRFPCACNLLGTQVHA
jgi:hypothetical protein